MTPRPKLNRAEARKWGIFALLLVLEAVLFVAMQKKEARGASLGFVLKDGSTYLVAWRQGENRYQLSRFDGLEEAMQFAEEDLMLQPARTRRLLDRFPMERVWVSDMSGSYTLLWKVSTLPHLFRWTFDRETDAHYFADHFLNGGYSHSPFGHSLLLLPRSP